MARLLPSTMVGMWVVLCPASTSGAELDWTSETVCGPKHRPDVRRIMTVRNANVAGGAPDSESELRLNRGLIVRDFLRLRGERSDVVPEPVRSIDVTGLRRDGDAGRLTADVCAVVDFMSEYYTQTEPASDASRTYLRGHDAPAEARAVVASSVPRIYLHRNAAPPEALLASGRIESYLRGNDALMEALELLASGMTRTDLWDSAAPEEAALDGATSVALAPTPPRPRPRRPEPVATHEHVHEAPPPAADLVIPPTLQLTAFSSSVMSDPHTDRVALELIADIDEQLSVPRYLTFREARIEARSASEEELATRRDASLQAIERIVALLASLNLSPQLRESVQASLGKEGREQLEQRILHSFQSVPDRRQRARALTLWAELEAAALEKR